MKHALESHKAFEPVAWIVFIAGTGLVIGLVISLQNATAHLELQTNKTIKTLDTSGLVVPENG